MSTRHWYWSHFLSENTIHFGVKLHFLYQKSLKCLCFRLYSMSPCNQKKQQQKIEEKSQRFHAQNETFGIFIIGIE